MLVYKKVQMEKFKEDKNKTKKEQWAADQKIFIRINHLYV